MHPATFIGLLLCAAHLWKSYTCSLWKRSQFLKIGLLLLMVSAVMEIELMICEFTWLNRNSLGIPRFLLLNHKGCFVFPN